MPRGVNDIMMFFFLFGLNQVICSKEPNDLMKFSFLVWFKSNYMTEGVNDIMNFFCGLV